jgi:hypothetical protein
MVSPGILNLTFPQGATWDLSLTYKASNGTPVNLTNYTARMQVRSSYASATAVLSLTDTAGITLGGAAGTVVVAVSASTAATIEANQYVYDLELVSGGGTVTRLVQGTFTVTPEVTR